MNKKVLKEMRFMMERIESPRMTYTEYENKKKSINESKLTNKEFINKLNLISDNLEKYGGIENVIVDDLLKVTDNNPNHLSKVLRIITSYMIGKNNKDVDFGSLREYISSIPEELGKKFGSIGQPPIINDMCSKVLKILFNYYSVDFKF